MRVLANLDKGEAYKIKKGEQVIIADTGNLNSLYLENLTDADEIFKKSISLGYVDHHVADTLPLIQEKEIKCCSTQIVANFYEDVLEYINKNNVKEIYIHKDTDLDAICSGWMIKYLGENQKLPEIAKEMAPIVNKVDYAIYRTENPENYAYSFPGCMRGIMNSIKFENFNDLKNNPLYANTRGIINDLGKRIAEEKTNNEIIKLLDIIENEKQINPEFDINMPNFNEFIENNNQISSYVKSHLTLGINRFLKDQDEFNESVENASIINFQCYNPITKEKTTEKIMLLKSNSPLKTTNVAYNTYQDRIIAAYNPLKNWFAIGIAAESLKKFRPTMKQLCIKLNHIEENKRKQLYDKPFKTSEEIEIIHKIESYKPVEAFNGADKLKLINKAPVPLVGGGALIVQSHCGLIDSFDEFKNILQDFAKKTNSFNCSKDKYFE
ncbi:MAG: hypothetical protein IKW39_03845 [Alphaproteobacteria bacterium]|nr:hypothetical protein [Alphaproteobacteria bacterium]